MKKIIYFMGISVVTGIFIYACQKKEILKTSSQNAHFEKTKNYADKALSANLISMLENPDLSDFEKGKALLEEDELSPVVISRLLDGSENFDPYVLELVLSSQSDIDEVNLMRIVNSNHMSDGMVKSILMTRKNINNGQKEQIHSKRPSLNLNEISGMNGMEKAICMCTNQMIFAEHIVELEENGQVQYIMENPLYFPLSGNTNSDNMNQIAGGCGGKWVCGNYTEWVSSNGKTTIGTCAKPPNDAKCMKKLKTPKLLANDQSLISQLHSSKSSLAKAKTLLEQTDYSQEVLKEFISMKNEFSDFVSEIVLLSANKVDEDNLIRLIASKTHSDGVVENVLILNAPLSERVSKAVENLRPDLQLSDINSFADKEIGISLCASTLMIGEEITVTPVTNNKTDIWVRGLEYRNFASNVNDADLEFMMEGCGGNYTCGNLLVISTDPTNTLTKFTCQKPPNRKCYKKAKTASK